MCGVRAAFKGIKHIFLRRYGMIVGFIFICELMCLLVYRGMGDSKIFMSQKVSPCGDRGLGKASSLEPQPPGNLTC